VIPGHNHNAIAMSETEPDKSNAPPSDWVLRFAGLVPPGGAVLDLAAGGGRHARSFLERGHQVTAVDRDTDRLADLKADRNIEVIRTDLENGSPWPLGNRRFAAVVVANYLHRPLMKQVLGAVAPGGLLLYETFAAGNEAFGRPSNPDFLLRPGELLELVRGELTVVAYEFGLVEREGSAVIQRICARRGEAPVALT